MTQYNNYASIGLYIQQVKLLPCYSEIWGLGHLSYSRKKTVSLISCPGNWHPALHGSCDPAGWGWSWLLKGRGKIVSSSILGWRFSNKIKWYSRRWNWEGILSWMVAPTKVSPLEPMVVVTLFGKKSLCSCNYVKYLKMRLPWVRGGCKSNGKCP